jgi:large subunit ribosomal protein L17
MWHRRLRRRLGLRYEHRKALLRNLVLGLVESGRIRTTYTRAKEAARFADRLVTIAKRGTMHARREVRRDLPPRATKKLVDEIAPVFKEQPGGYTRVLRYDHRPGDGAEMAILEFTQLIERKEAPPAEKEKKKKKKEEKKAKEVAPAEEKPKKEKPAKRKVEKAAKEEESPAKKEPTPEEKKPEGREEEPKKGGFLSNLRKFLTGE